MPESLRDSKKSGEATEKVLGKMEELKGAMSMAEELKPELKDDSKAEALNEENLEDMKGQEQFGKPFTASRSGKTYYAKPCALADIPKLVKEVKEIEKIFAGSADTPPTELLTRDDNHALKHMSAIIALAFDDQITADQAMKEFSLGDFPKLYKVCLDINDFLSGMRTIYN